MVDYAVLPDCLNEVKNNPAVRGLSPSTDYDSHLDNQLVISAGKNSSDVTIYRPYYVAAKFLEQLRSQQILSKAEDGVTFTGLAKPIESLLNLQAALDLSLGLTVPEGFEAILPQCVTCDSPTTTTRYRTRSHRPTLRP
jgi:hypothetical protein